MTTPKDPEEDTLDEEKQETPEVPKPHIPLQKVSRFGNQGSKFGKAAMGANPPMKQRPGRAAGRGR